MSLSALSSTSKTDDAGLAPGDFDLLRKLLVDQAGIVLERSQEYLAEARLPPVARQHGMSDISEIIAALRNARDKELEIDVIDNGTITNGSAFITPNGDERASRTSRNSFRSSRRTRKPLN